MTKISILPIPTDLGDLSHHAIAGMRYALGKTAGEALDALTAQLSEDDTSTLVIMQSLRPDPFFTAAQQERLMVLIARWRNARDQGNTLPIDEQTELEKLIEAELHASEDRAKKSFRVV